MTAPKLRFKAFDGAWTFSKIGEIFKVTSGSTPLRSDNRFFENAHIPWVKTTDLNDSFIYETEEKISEIALKETSVKILPKGTVFVAMYGGFNQIGRTGLLLNESACNQALSAIYPHEKIDSFFLLTYLNHKVDDWKNFAASSRKDPNITKSDVLAFPFVYPSKTEQTKIASFLSAVDEKISQLNKKHELLSQYKQGMMQKLFSQQIRFKADDGEEFGEWEVIQANQIFENYSNKNHDGTLTILAATQDKGVVPRDEIDIDIKSSDASVLSYKIIEKGNFVISLRSFQGGIEYSNYHGICSPAYTILKSIKPIASDFYKNYLKTNDFIQRLSATVIGIRDGKQISYQAFSTLMIDYPSVEEQTKIADFLSAIDQKIEVVTQQIEQAKTWKKGLLQQMFV